jgi:hypothetical protein
MRTKQLWFLIIAHAVERPVMRQDTAKLTMGQSRPDGLTSNGRRHAAIVLLLGCILCAVSACTRPLTVSILSPPDERLTPELVNLQADQPVTVTVNPDGTFTPNVVNIQAGQKIRWLNLSTTDAIVQIGDPMRFPTADVCGIADNDLDHRVAANDPNEFTGPSRKAVSGIFVLGQDGPGFVQQLATEPCDSGASPLTVDSLDGNTYQLCRDGTTNQMLDTTWRNPDITGVILRLNWRALQIDNGGVIEFFWDDLDREMNNAVANGKLFTLDVSAGKDGTPDWIFNDYDGPAGPGPVVRYTFKDWGSEAFPPNDNCGFDLDIGSPADTAYRDLYVAMIEALADHVAGDARWFQALAHVKISGANFLSSEARLPNRCYDKLPADGMLDTIGRDACLCNAQTWANAGYTPEKLYEYYRVVGNAIYNAFYQRKSLGYQLIQAGFPLVESVTNFEGDSLQDQDGNLLLDPPGVTTDDITGTLQTETVLREGREGRFFDPSGTKTDLTAGKLFVSQHNGLGRLRTDLDATRNSCSQAATVDSVTQRALFPLPTGIPGDPRAGCPNRWAVEEGTLYGQIMGFQTQNLSAITTTADLESALWNLTINSNGVYLEIYEPIAWQIYHTLGTGATAPVLDATRIGLPNNPAPYSKNLFTWTEELHARRTLLADPANPNLREPFPSSYQHTFARRVAVPETYYYINPAKCALTTDANRVGQITVVP